MEGDKTVFEICIGESAYLVQPLHQVPFLINECCELINSEWKRSLTARLRSIEGSCENFPMSLLLLKKAGKPKVIGHCKVSRLSLSKNKLFVDSVVIHKNFRGKGLGKFLMLSIEEIARRKEFKWIFLTTKGQELFYEKLGYVECPPVSIFGSSEIDESDDSINKNNNIFSNLKSSNLPKISYNNNTNLISKPPLSQPLTYFPDACSTSPPPPPPPPPLLPFLSVLSANSSKPSIVTTRTFMKKEII